MHTHLEQKQTCIVNISDLLQKRLPLTTLEDNLFFDWDEFNTAQVAAVRAFERYIQGDDLYLLPRTRNELESILRRYARDSVHNTIALSRSALPLGGYSEVCRLAEKNIHAVLDVGDNTEVLLRLHAREIVDATNLAPVESPHIIKTQ